MDTMYVIIGCVGGSALVLALTAIGRNEYIYRMSRRRGDEDDGCGRCNKQCFYKMSLLPRYLGFHVNRVQPQPKEEPSNGPVNGAAQVRGGAPFKESVDVMFIIKKLHKQNLIDAGQAKRLSGMVPEHDPRLLRLLRRYNKHDVALSRNQNFATALVEMARKLPSKADEDKARAEAAKAREAEAAAARSEASAAARAAWVRAAKGAAGSGAMNLASYLKSQRAKKSAADEADDQETPREPREPRGPVEKPTWRHL